MLSTTYLSARRSLGLSKENERDRFSLQDLERRLRGCDDQSRRLRRYRPALANRDCSRSAWRSPTRAAQISYTTGQRPLDYFIGKHRVDITAFEVELSNPAGSASPLRTSADAPQHGDSMSLAWVGVI